MRPNQIHYNRYINFIYSRRFREIPEETYTERHHIIPRSLNGSNEKSNLIVLTGREHYIAHMILWKAFGKGMTTAFWFMQHLNRYKNKLTSRQYEKLKKERSQCFDKEWRKNMSEGCKKRYLNPANIESEIKRKNKISNTMKGRPAHNKGVPMSDSTKEKISRLNKGKINKNTNKGKQLSTKGKTWEEIYGIEGAQKRRETKKERKKMKGSYHTEATKKKIGKGNKNKIVSKETRKKMSNAHKGKKNITKGTIWVINIQNKERKRIKFIELDIYIKLGFRKGKKL